MGDFNGRTGDLDDNYDNSYHNDQHIPTPNLFSDCPNRKNCDKVNNSHGNKIINFCKTYDFKILNGRMKGDAIGNFTHLNAATNGTSTIDYGLCNQYMYQKVENVIILPLNEISDHSKIATILKCNTTPKINEDEYNWKKLKTRFKWDKKNIKMFINNFKVKEREIDEISQRVEAGLIESTGQKIQKLYFDVAKNTLEQTGTNKNWKKRKKTKKWYDGECCKLKKVARAIGRESHKKPHENILRTKFHEKLKEYKKTCRNKKQRFWRKSLDEIENSLNDPNTFWKKWKNANDTSTPPEKPDITGDTWYNHFKNLHTEKCNEVINEGQNNQNQILDKVELNKPFTRKEFNTIIKNLKTEKTAGSDSILNEMIKYSPIIILDIIFRFINLCLLQSLIPKSWCLDLLNPIHKDGNKSDPNNYRGICISSVLLKILCSLMNKRIQTQCSKLKLVNKNQTGFKKNHRTSDNLLALKGVVKKICNDREKEIIRMFY